MRIHGKPILGQRDFLPRVDSSLVIISVGSVTTCRLSSTNTNTYEIEKEGKISSVNVLTADKFEIKPQRINSSLDKPWCLTLGDPTTCLALGKVQTSVSLE